MDDIKNDPRFAKILSDPKFRSMPKSKRKVKIDSRFQSLFTSKHFSHRTDIDKRGRPVLDSAKRNKHVMERFYELSSDESDEESDTDETQHQDSKKQNVTVKPSKLLQSSARSQAVPSKKRKQRDNDLDGAITGTLNKKKKRADTISTPPSAGPSSANTKNGTVNNADDGSEDDAVVTDSDVEGESSDVKDDEDNNTDSGDDDDTELPEFTDDHVIEETEIDHKWNEHHLEAPQVSESTCRLALCNMDWDHVKAQDLFVLFKSFVPEGGFVKSVTIYPSEFGKERMAEEARLGPKEIRKTNGEDSERTDTEQKKKKKGKDQQQNKRAEKEKEALQTEKLREYQLNRLRYYYAVVDCDSVRTADMIYSECDGREYLLSSVRLDLRFIPDDMTFDDDPKEQFSENQSIIDYQPNVFNSTALSQAKVDVTWDETDFDRLSKRISGLQPKELESIVEENKYADIIAPPESDSEDEDGRPEWLRKVLDEAGEDKDEVTEEEKIKMYRQLLMDKITAEEEEKKKEEGEFDKEIEWQPGLKSSVEKKIKKRDKKKDDSVLVSEYLDKKKEKKRRKKEEKLKKKKQSEEGGSDAEQAFSDDDIPEGFDLEDMRELVEGEPDLEHVMKSKQSRKKKKNKKAKGGLANDENDELDEREKAELELMLMDEEGDKSLAKPEKVETPSESKRSKKKKEKKMAKLKQQEQEKEDFVLDVNDPRFGALYTSHHFHIDPNAPQFKKTKNMTKLVDEQIKRKNKKQKMQESNANSVVTKTVSPVSDSKSVSQSLVESLKKKMKKK